MENRWIALCLVLVAFVGVARGEQQPDADPDTEIARRHFDKGTAFYNEGRYAEAIGEFEAARKTKPLPAFDFNIARAHDRLEHPREAIAAYEHYLAGAPTAPDAAEVRARVAVLMQRLGEGAPPDAAARGSASLPPPPADSSPPPLARRRVYTWAVGGAGVALLAGSLVAGLVANSRYGTLKGECAADGSCNGATAPDAQGLIDGGHAGGLASDVLLGVGLAAVVTGVVLFFVEGRHPVERRAWRLAPAAGGVGLAWEAP
jgi:hypothetical protein